LTLRGNGNFDIHNWFKDLRAALLETFSKGIFCSKTEGQRGRVHYVSLTIGKDILNTYDRIASLRSLLCALMESFFNSRNIFIRNVLSFSFVYELT
jgi:hypothetical protein